MRNGLAKIKNAVDIIRKTRPVYATALMTMDRVPCKDTYLMATNGVVLKYNDDNCAKLPLQEVVFVLMHEVLHKWMSHPSRYKAVCNQLDTSQREQWQIAADLAVNSLLYQQGETLPKTIGCIIPEGDGFEHLPHGKTAEWYFSKIKDDTTDDGHSDEIGGDLIPSDEASEVEQLQEVGVSVASAKGQHAGRKSTDVIAKVLDDMLAPPKLNYKAILRRYLTETASHRVRSFSRENRRSDGEFILPSYKKGKDLCKTCVVMDTSGSMDELCQDVLYECVGFAEQYPNTAIEVVMCDTEVRAVHTLRSKADVQKLLKAPFMGGGGTDMTHAFKHAVREKAKLILCLTDMEMSFPKNPKIPVVWLAFRNSYYAGKPSYGDVVKLYD